MSVRVSQHVSKSLNVEACVCLYVSIMSYAEDRHVVTIQGRLFTRNLQRACLASKKKDDLFGDRPQMCWHYADLEGVKSLVQDDDAIDALGRL